MTKLIHYTHVDICKNALTDDDIFKNFKKIPEYTKILEHTTEHYGREYMKLIINDHNKYVDLLDWNKLKENDTIGNPTLINFYELGGIINGGNNYYSPSTIYYIYRGLHIIDNILKTKTNVSIIEIGGGYGGQCKILLDLCAMLNIKVDNYGIIDLEYVSKLQKRYLNAFGYTNIEFFEYENISEFNVFKKYKELISVYALSEFEIDVQNYYVDNIIKYVDDYYILCNVQMTTEFFSKSKLIDGLPNTGRYHKLMLKNN